MKNTKNIIYRNKTIIPMYFFFILLLKFRMVVPFRRGKREQRGSEDSVCNIWFQTTKFLKSFIDKPQKANITQC